MKLLLFDIDGTLVLTGGAGVRAMNRAFEAVFGVPDAFRGIPMAGRTDPAILSEACTRAGLSPDRAGIGQFERVYHAALGEEILAPPTLPADQTRPRSFKGALPGVPELVDRLTGDADVFLALLTGNYSEAARTKLAHFDLWRHFRCGAFGEDGDPRHALVPVAVARAREAGCPAVAPSDVTIVGDTPRDVECAREAGVSVVAVATGGYDTATLRAAGAVTVFESLIDTTAVIEALTGRRVSSARG